MKKFIAILLAMVLVVGLVACGDEAKVEKFVKEHGQEFSDGVAQGFSSSGMSCDATMEAKGDGVVVKICVDQFDDIDASTKAIAQANMNNTASSFQSSLKAIQNEEPAVKFMEVQLCECDGDLIAKVTVR